MHLIPQERRWALQGIGLQKIKHEQRKSDNLLLNILPSSTADRLKDGETLIADDIEDATVLFADIPNFTSLSNEITA